VYREKFFRRLDGTVLIFQQSLKEPRNVISLLLLMKHRNFVRFNVIHEAFFEPMKKLGVVLIGPGNIGGTFLKQISSNILIFVRKDLMFVCAEFMISEKLSSLQKESI